MKKHQYNITLVCRMLITICLTVVVFLTIVQINAFNEKFYTTEYKKYNISSTTGMSFEDLNRVTTKLINYISGKEDNLNIQAKIQGQTGQVFGQKEKQHMIDVKELFEKGFSVRNISVLIVILAVFMLFKVSDNTKKDIYKSIFYSSVLSLIVTILLVIFIKIDFDKYFTYFHKVFFNNELWLLNPETDVLINMLPLEFFIDIAWKIIIWFLVVETTIFMLSLIMLKRIKAHSNK